MAIHIILLIIFIINIALILSVVFIEHKNPNEAVLWIAVLTIFPIVGIIFYLIFGSTLGIKIRYLIREHKLSKGYYKYVYEQLNQVKSRYIYSEDPMKNNLKGMVEFNLNYSHGLITKYNEIETIISGKEKYNRLFKDIKEAQKSIHIEYYSIHNDEVGIALVEALTKKAEQGLDIKVMFDKMGSITTPMKMFNPLIKSGGKVRSVKPYFTHYRNHRKIVVIDGKIAYIGGMNIGKQYANLGKKKNPWRDTHIRIRGDGVYVLQYYFLGDWIFANKKENIDFYNKNIEVLFPTHNINNYLPCQFVEGGVNTEKESIKMSYLKMITSAKDRILIQSPYFIPDSSIFDALKMALASGVKVEVMLPEIKASFFLQPVGDYYIDKLLEYGIKIYKYKGYIHAKTLSIDGLVTCIGSVNLDIRSLQVDDEICGFIYDENFTRKHELIFENDKKSCNELDYEKFIDRGFWRKAQERFYRLFEPLM